MKAKDINKQLRKRNNTEGLIKVSRYIKRCDMESMTLYPGETYSDGEEAFRCVENPDGGCSHCVFYNEMMCMGFMCIDMECHWANRDDGHDVIFEKVPVPSEESSSAKDVSPKEEPSEKEPSEEPKSKEPKQPDQYTKITKDIPFDIELAKKGYQVVTRNGRPVRILSYYFENQKYPIVAAIKKIDEDTQVCEEIQIYTSEGHYDGPNPPSPLDLMIRCYMYSGWTNVYNIDSDIRLSDHLGWGADLIYPSEKEAREMKRSEGYMATVPIEWPVPLEKVED